MLGVLLHGDGKYSTTFFQFQWSGGAILDTERLTDTADAVMCTFKILSNIYLTKTVTDGLFGYLTTILAALIGSTSREIVNHLELEQMCEILIMKNFRVLHLKLNPGSTPCGVPKKFQVI
jgi:hypothetical protein